MMQEINKTHTLCMGKPITAPCLIPVLHSATPQCIQEPFTVRGKSYPLTALSFGCAHGVVVTQDVDAVCVPKLGEALGTHPRFPRGASIVFVQLLDETSLKARLWQYGVGEKPYSAEAACAAGTVAMLLQKVTAHCAQVHMGGIVVSVERSRDTQEVSVRGPVVPSAPCFLGGGRVYAD